MFHVCARILVFLLAWMLHHVVELIAQLVEKSEQFKTFFVGEANLALLVDFNRDAARVFFKFQDDFSSLGAMRSALPKTPYEVR